MYHFGAPVGPGPDSIDFQLKSLLKCTTLEIQPPGASRSVPEPPGDSQGLLGPPRACQNLKIYDFGAPAGPGTDSIDFQLKSY